MNLIFLGKNVLFFLHVVMCIFVLRIHVTLLLYLMFNIIHCFQLILTLTHNTIVLIIGTASPI